MPGSRRNAPPPQSIVEAWILKAHGKSAQAVWRAVELAFHFHQPSSHSVNIGPQIPVPFSHGSLLPSAQASRRRVRKLSFLRRLFQAPNARRKPSPHRCTVLIVFLSKSLLP